MSDLKKKAVKGVSWSLLDNIANSGITFVVGIILARILSPKEFGVLGMIAVFMALSNSIVDSGFSNALVRKTDAKNIDYNTVFIFNLIIALLVYGLLYMFSPAISQFFNEPILIPVTRVMGLILIINGLGIVQRTLLIKNINFKTQAKISLIASVSSGVVGVLLAYLGYGVWSLVGQQLTRQLLNVLLLWIFNSWRPVFEFSFESFKELFNFGSKLMLSSLIDTFYNNVFYIVIGRYYSAVQLGYFTRADQFKSIFANNLTTIIQRVSYPVLCTIQDDDLRLRSTYQKVIKATMMITFPCMLGMAAVSKSLIVVLIGVKWLPAVSFLQIICFSGMLYPLHAINLNMLQVKARTDLFLKLEIIKKIIAVGPILLGVLYGIDFMLWGAVFTSVIFFFLNSYYASGLINYSSWNQIKDIFPSFSVAIVTSAVMWCCTLLNLQEELMLFIQCSVGFCFFIFVNETIKLNEYFDLKSILIYYVSRKKYNEK